MAARRSGRSSQVITSFTTARNSPIAAPGVVLGRVVQPRAEDRVGGVLLDAHAADEREEAAGHVRRAVAEVDVVERHDDRAVARGLGARRPSSASSPGPSASRAGTSAGARRAPRPPPPAGCDAAVDATSPMPAAAAPRAEASSPSGWRICCTPIGASITGAASRVPSTSTERSRSAGVAQVARHQPPAAGTPRGWRASCRPSRRRPTRSPAAPARPSRRPAPPARPSPPGTRAPRRRAPGGRRRSASRRGGRHEGISSARVL